MSDIVFDWVRSLGCAWSTIGHCINLPISSVGRLLKDREEWKVSATYLNRQCDRFKDGIDDALGALRAADKPVQMTDEEFLRAKIYEARRYLTRALENKE